jgi:hypothetical protein
MKGRKEESTRFMRLGLPVAVCWLGVGLLLLTSIEFNFNLQQLDIKRFPEMYCTYSSLCLYVRTVCAVFHVLHVPSLVKFI